MKWKSTERIETYAKWDIIKMCRRVSELCSLLVSVLILMFLSNYVNAEESTPKLEDYPVTEIFSEKHADPAAKTGNNDDVDLKVLRSVLKRPVNIQGIT